MLAERPELLAAVLPYAALQNGRGRRGYLVRFFLDGFWQGEQQWRCSGALCTGGGGGGRDSASRANPSHLSHLTVKSLRLTL